jgi:hypothetical protein
MISLSCYGTLWILHQQAILARAMVLALIGGGVWLAGRVPCQLARVWQVQVVLD